MAPLTTLAGHTYVLVTPIFNLKLFAEINIPSSCSCGSALRSDGVYLIELSKTCPPAETDRGGRGYWQRFRIIEPKR